MRKIMLLLVSMVLFAPVSGLMIDDFEHASLFRWYNAGAPSMTISEFGLGSYSLMINNSDEMFYITYYNPYPTEVGGSDLRFKMYYTPSETSGPMSILCFMLYDDESSESRVVTPETWTFNEWNEMSCNGGANGRLVSVIIYFINMKGTVYIDDLGYRDEPQGPTGLTGMALLMQGYVPIFIPALVIGAIGIYLIRRSAR